MRLLIVDNDEERIWSMQNVCVYISTFKVNSTTERNKELTRELLNFENEMN
jgi:hypothetical protein